MDEPVSPQQWIWLCVAAALIALRFVKGHVFSLPNSLDAVIHDADSSVVFLLFLWAAVPFIRRGVETTRTRSSPSRRSMLLLGTAVSFGVLVWISFNIWTTPAGMFWHLVHGKSASFEGHPIHVPWDMWVSSSNTNALTIIRQAPQYSWTHSPSGILLFVRDQGAPTDFSKNYERIAATNGSQKGYRFQGLQKLEGQKGSVFCWELTKADSSSITISCQFDHDTLSARYDGSPMYRAGFYKAVAVVAGARSEQR
jgi:hypothetical protein